MIEFKTMTSLERAPDVLRMMEALFTEDAAAFDGVDFKKFKTTLDTLLKEPRSGSVILIEADGSLVGYALLIPYWSNEFGGRLLFVDEIFVRAERRGQGIAKAFFRHLEQSRPFGAIACALEASQKNTRARALYQSIGFQVRTNSMLVNYWG